MKSDGTLRSPSCALNLGMSCGRASAASWSASSTRLRLPARVPAASLAQKRSSGRSRAIGSSAPYAEQGVVGGSKSEVGASQVDAGDDDDDGRPSDEGWNSSNRLACFSRRSLDVALEADADVDACETAGAAARGVDIVFVTSSPGLRWAFIRDGGVERDGV